MTDKEFADVLTAKAAQRREVTEKADQCASMLASDLREVMHAWSGSPLATDYLYEIIASVREVRGKLAVLLTEAEES